MPTARQAGLLGSATAWARSDARVRALLLKGSLGRDEGDDRSDLDLVVVTMPGRLAELWADRAVVAGRLGEVLGGFDEVAWQAPHTYLALYPGPLKVDLFFQDGTPRADPGLRDELARQVRATLATPRR